MLSDSITYSGIVTKSKAMGSKLISIDEYNHISQLETTADFITFLKVQPSYSNIYANYDEHSLHRGQIEHLLMNALYVDYAKLYQFANPMQRRSLSFVFFRYEVNILKKCIHCVFSQEETEDFSIFEPFFEKFSKLKIRALATSKNMEEFISLLKGTVYYSLFFRMLHTEHLTLYDYEVQLDIFYFTRVWKLKDKVLKGKERNTFTRIIGSQIDLLNIVWVYRSKKHYNMDSTKIFVSIISIPYKLSALQLTKLVESANLSEFMTLLRTTFYGDINMDESIQFEMEREYRQRINKIYQENKLKYPASMAPIYNFLHLKEQEIDRLTTALECIRYQLAPNETISYILEQNQ